jgi:serine/threonine protein kinase/Tol biopolymer transport system component
MTLAAGQHIGAYAILSPLGTGGMGEVYRARDTRLGRDVAIKVLPAAFAADHDRMVRFQREAQVLASLNHPHIASIFGFEESNSTRALVMELVEGPTLHERIAAGAISIEEALPIAKQIAEALEYAHEHGIVHRDLKPANIKLTRDGAVKVLDFGLAKALSDDPLSSEVSNSPTLSAVATRAGIILGTAAYMSPEQAKGKTADRRADIWSFGVVLYEMLTGQRLFTGETSQETLAAVIRAEPDWSALPPSVPARVRRLLRRCLEKDPRRRVQAIAEARIAIEDTLVGAAEDTPLAVPSTEPPWRRTLPWALVGALSLILALVLVLWVPRPPAPELATPVRLSVEVGADASLATGLGPAAILSPDGKLLAFASQKATGQRGQLYMRRLEQLRASPLAGTEGARDPFFSPDSQWLGFFADGKLRKVAVTGGAPVTVCDASDDRGGAWTENGTILFTPGIAGGVSRVSAAGGTPEILTRADPAAGASSDRWPQALPGGKAVLFTSSSSSPADWETASIVAQSLPEGPRKVLLRNGYHGRYLRSGHIVYMREGTLFAVPFDLGRLELTGPPAPVLEGVDANTRNGGAQFAFSDRGTVVFVPSPTTGPAVPILWMDKDGKTEPLRTIASDYSDSRFSPDGHKLAMDIRDGRERDVWVYDWARDTMSRLTFDPGQDGSPVWTPDGQRIAFASTRGDKRTENLYWQRADGTGEAERLTESKNRQFPTSWHPSGKFLAFYVRSSPTAHDIWILPMEGDKTSGWRPGKPIAFLDTPFTEVDSAFSPDGKWLAYMSNESGQFEIYVRPFPGPGGKWQISTGGGIHPTWSRMRRELFYTGPPQAVMVARYASEGASFRAEKPQLWSAGTVPARGVRRAFDLHPDGRRLAVVKPEDQQMEERRDKVIFIENFFDELRRVAPAGER